MVVKKGGRRERFDRAKALSGLLKACEKRPVSVRSLEEAVGEVEQALVDAPDREITSEEIGRRLMQRLKLIDKVAYVRFASVYLEFADVKEFTHEVAHLSQ
jgi:transcriptional repressor NrdR